MRNVYHHVVKGDTASQLKIQVVDEPGQGGACHEYRITTDSIGGGKSLNECRISFQNGPIKENGVNGISQEALLAIVLDRLESFQNGPYACDANKMALIGVQTAL